MVPAVLVLVRLVGRRLLQLEAHAGRAGAAGVRPLHQGADGVRDRRPLHPVEGLHRLGRHARGRQHHCRPVQGPVRNQGREGCKWGSVVVLVILGFLELMY